MTVNPDVAIAWLWTLLHNPVRDRDIIIPIPVEEMRLRDDVTPQRTQPALQGRFLFSFAEGSLEFRENLGSLLWGGA